MPWNAGPKARCERLERLNEDLKLSMSVITDPKNVIYTSGFMTTSFMLPTYLFIRIGKDPMLITGENVKPKVERKFGGEIATYTSYDLSQRMIPYPDFVAKQTSQYLDISQEVHRIGIDSWNIPYTLVRTISENYPQSEFVDISDELRKMRMIKDADEIEEIRKSCKLNDFAYSIARDIIAEGLSEVEVYAEVHANVVKKSGSFQFFSGDFISGERCIDIGGPPTVKKLINGETFILDLWVTTNGYWSDASRTFVVGHMPSDSQIALLKTTKKAMDRGEEMLVPGSSAADVYHAVYKAIDEEGYGERFPHHAGHAIGLDGQEAPFFIPGCSDKLKEGMVCTLEPGIYLPDVGGVRIEHNYLITKEGPETMTTFPIEL